MAFDRDMPADADIARWFLDAPDVPPRTFELALVLGGTVSAGAYTAGAVDFLIQALDCFAAAKATGAAPAHDVVLKLITGTSGGGVNAAIAARALGYDFPHVVRDTPVGAANTGNPFYDVWVKTLRLDRFLDTSDIKGDVPSLLNGGAIDAGGAYIVGFQSGPARARSWVGSPLRVILTLTSLRGVPYRTALGPTLGQSYVDHADHARFAFVYPGETLAEPRPDERVLCFGAEQPAQPIGWSEFSRVRQGHLGVPGGVSGARAQPAHQPLPMAGGALPTGAGRRQHLHGGPPGLGRHDPARRRRRAGGLALPLGGRGRHEQRADRARPHRAGRPARTQPARSRDRDPRGVADRPVRRARRSRPRRPRPPSRANSARSSPPSRSRPVTARRTS